jgi:hypothetical protein
MEQKTNGQVLEEEFFQEPESPKTGGQDLDLDEYRAGKPLELPEVKELDSIPRVEARKPRAKEWFRCSNEPLERVWIYEGDGIGEIYLVHPAVALEMPDEFSEAYLALCISLSGRLFLWPIKCSAGGEDFTDAALQQVNRAKAGWIRRVKWINHLGIHKVEFNTVENVTPEWPKEVRIRDIIARAFGEKVIRSVDHPCLRLARSAR